MVAAGLERPLSCTGYPSSSISFLALCRCRLLVLSLISSFLRFFFESSDLSSFSSFVLFLLKFMQDLLQRIAFLRALQALRLEDLPEFHFLAPVCSGELLFSPVSSSAGGHGFNVLFIEADQLFGFHIGDVP